MFAQLKHKILRGQTWQQWLAGVIRFCVVGLGSYVVDVGLFNFLAYSGFVSLPWDASMVAKTISVSVAVVFSWVTNRLWTFNNRSDKPLGREFILFVAVNIGGLLISLGCLWVSRYAMGATSQLADNISANIVGLVLGTAFRYVCYRYVVFAPAKTSEPSHS
ncbi:MAG: GtrA family protein [Actinomycetaceae bacterium]|nr:GtrA family protein [Actinomycetaceae bacterium]